MKAFTKILCLLLAMMMVLSLAACSKDDDGDKGDDKQKETVADKDTGKEEDKDTDKDTDKEETIVGTWEGTLTEDTVNAFLGTEWDVDLDVTLYLELAKNGSGKFYLADEDIDEFAVTMAMALLEEIAASLNMSPDELLATEDMTMDEYIADVKADVAEGGFDAAFTYTVDGDELSMVKEGDEKVFTFELDGDKLKIDTDATPKIILEAMCPATFTRVK